LEHLGAGAGILPLAAARGGLAVTATGPAADAFLGPALDNALMYCAEVHYRVTPRSWATSSRVRSSSRPCSVALTRLSGLVLPCVWVRMSWTPAHTRTSRTPGPALTPVPGPAGTMMTRLLP